MAKKNENKERAENLLIRFRRQGLDKSLRYAQVCAILALVEAVEKLSK